MAVTVFISYSHADMKHLERLHKHMAQLLRDGVFETSRALARDASLAAAMKLVA
ncbi:hypothetical protein [Rhizobium leguminosarum]|uniref:hypothetical protein n=1 Tax=Rhizobium leguminosarum TaxID=384 RepID=UPI001FDEFBC1|nr:hypothetical protein [Rhizobium leguminosarum]